MEGKDADGRDVIGLYVLNEDNTCHLLCTIYNDHLSLHAAIIDKSTIWYGSVNILGYRSIEDNLTYVSEVQCAAKAEGLVDYRQG